MMPELDGYEACDVLMKDPKTKDTAIIFLSALQGTEEKIRGLSLGAVDYITKPFDGDEVKARVRRQVELWEEKQKLRLENSRLMIRSSKTLPDSLDQEKQVRNWIDQGETEHTEFKSTLRWSLTKNQVDRGVEVAWLKTVAAFLNSGGGTLIVGVGDKGEILGIKKDNFPNEDKYLLHVNNRIQQHIGLEHAQNIEYSLIPIDQEKVLVIECKSSSVPAFFVQGNEESFYIRVGPGTRKLSISQTLTYLSEREKSR
jgi:CheY-like chemotaxis protein